nr:MAG TPA: hypothetical protein [Caudoviricetes sp.]
MLYKTFEAPKSLCIFVHKQYEYQPWHNYYLK